jgi:predicted Zn-dependent protease
MVTQAELSKIAELESLVAENPGSAEFVELALLLSEEPESRARAREICFRGLSESPQSHRGRLVLAKLYYLDGMWEFAIRELVELKRLHPLTSLDHLLSAFGDSARPYLESTGACAGMTTSAGRSTGAVQVASTPEKVMDDAVVAEMDFDSEFFEILDELEDQE